MQQSIRLGLRLLVVPIGIVVALLSEGVASARGIPDITREGFPNIQSASALVIDLNTNAVLYERDADTVRPIASVSKLVGSIVIHEECKLDPAGLHEMTKANREAARGGDKTKLATGWRYSHSDLLHAALMRSDNRALPALGEACGMDPKTFGARMTARVRKMGLIRTTFKEPNGLSAENVSTARELAVILKEAISIPELVSIMATREYEITAINKQGRARRIKIRSTDRLLSQNSTEIIGGKTGYTDVARYCFAVAARAQGRDIGMIFLGAEGRFTRFADYNRVIKWLDPGDQIAKQDKPRPAVKPLNSPVSAVDTIQPKTLPAPDAVGIATPTPSTTTGQETVESMSW